MAQKLGFLFCIVLVFISCKNDAINDGDTSYQDVLHLPETPFNYSDINFPSTFTQYVATFNNTPSDNPITDAGATLGRVLFYDTSLSVSNTISCASCHKQEKGFADDGAKSIGFAGEHTFRNSMGFANAGFYKPERFFWDQRAATLEEQTLMPIQDDVEMGMTLTQLIARLNQIAYYKPLFEDAFGDETITSERISKALAQFVRSIYSFNTKYDVGIEMTQNIFEDFPNFTPQENLGKDIFNGKRTPEAIGTCVTCHLPNHDPLNFELPLPEDLNQVIFSGGEPDNIGLDDTIDVADNGWGEFLGIESLYGHFKTPSLRNIELTGPYMHDGRFETLEEVVEHYSTEVKPHPYLSAHMKDSQGNPRHLNLTEEEKAALVAFLKTLTDYELISDPKYANPFE
jgi:cytochrome c peroxidase